MRGPATIWTRASGPIATLTRFGGPKPPTPNHKRAGRPHLFRRPGHDEDWPAWYAAHIVAEQTGTDLPA